jgi:ABC-type amino acid transport substrate-binding protein
MQRLSRVGLMVALLAILLTAFAVNAQEELPDLEGQTVTVAVENAYPPFNYLDEETGEAIGWDYDTINEICERLNCTPEYIETSWEGMIVAVSNGEFDMAADGITITEERAEIVDFSIPYVSIVQRLMVQLEEDRFATLQDFVDGEFTVGVQLATTNYITAEALVGEDRLVGFSDFGAAVQALIAGDVDAVVIDDVAGQGYTGVNADEVELLEEALTDEGGLGFIYPQGSELTAAVDAALESMIADGTLEELNILWGLVGGGEEEMAELPDLEGQTVTVAVENAYPPFNYLDEETGEAIGWDYDTINEICERLNCTPEYIETSWEGMIVAVSNGEFDMAADGITITEERAEIVDFSIPYVSIVQRLMVQLEEDRFATLQDFVDGEFTVGVQLATTNYITAEALVGEDRLVGFSDFGAAVQALIAGDVDAVVIDDVAGQGYTGVNADEVELLEEALTDEGGLGFIYPQGSELTAAVDAALESMIADGTLEELNILWGLVGGGEE